MLDYFTEMKTSITNSTLDSQRFSIEEAENIFDPIKKDKKPYIIEKSSVEPIEMESVHIDIQKEECKKGIFHFLTKGRK